jgi:drug/metabolite transporter (DMT)-like permease
MQTGMYTGVALAAFAANSVLCRLALGGAAIDAASFSVIRLVSGAVGLSLIAAVFRRGRSQLCGTWTSAALLFLYAGAFSFAYVELSTGTGALILFGAVQATMIAVALWSRHRPDAREGVGILLALGGLVYLVSPGLAAPSLRGSVLMAIAGSAWGVYSVRGRGVADPLANTAGNFVRALPLAVGLDVLTPSSARLSLEGVLLAVLSGVLTSGLGYVLWYAALRRLTATQAAVVQLAVPVLAAGGGVAFLSEEISTRLVLAGVLILGGVGLVLRDRGKGRQRELRSASTPGRVRAVAELGLPRD